MTIDYQVYGPFEIPQTDKRNHIDREKTKSEFWKKVEIETNGLSDACGCYIFAVRAGKGALPWYVGKASRQTFKQECLQAGKLVNYNDILNKRKGTPILYFLPKVTETGKFSRPSNTKAGYQDVDFLERFLIGMALNRNRNLLNLKDTKMHSQITVPGILNSGKNYGSSAKNLKKVFGL